MGGSSSTSESGQNTPSSFGSSSGMSLTGAPLQSAPGMDNTQPNLSGLTIGGGNMLSSPPPTAASTTQAPQGTLAQLSQSSPPAAPQPLTPPPTNSFSQPMGSPMTGSSSPLGGSGSMQLMGGDQNMLAQILQALRGGG